MGLRPAGIRRKIVLALAAALAAAVVAGCGAPADGPQAVFDPDAYPSGNLPARHVNAGEVRGTVELMTWSSPVETMLLRRTLARFRSTYPNVKVVFRPTNGDYPSTVLTRFAGGDAPDVLVVDNKDAPDWIAKGMLAPLDGYLRGNEFGIDQFYPQLLDGFQNPAGNLYGIPKDYSTLGLYVNDDMLRQAGVSRAPRTWDELRATARKLSRKGGPYGMCIAPSWARMSAFAAQTDGGLVSEDWRSMAVRRAGTREAVKFYLSFLRDGIGTTPQAVGASWCGDAFGKQQVAMAMEGNWMLPLMQNSYPGISYHIHQLPYGRKRGNLAYSPAYGISRLSRNPDAAWVLLQYLTGREGMRAWTNEGLALPSRRDVPVLPGREAFSAGLDGAIVWQLPPGFSNKVLMTAENELTAVLEGDQTLDGMLRQIDRIGAPMLARLKGVARHEGGPLVLAEDAP